MNKPYRENLNDEAIEALAAAWLTQRDDGLTPEQEEAFARWRNLDGRHESAVVRIETATRLLEKLPLLDEEALMPSAQQATTVPGDAITGTPNGGTGQSAHPAAEPIQLPSILPYGKAGQPTASWRWRAAPFAPALAAAAAVLLAVAGWFWWTARAGVFHQDYATTVGGYSRLTLPDGSIVDLNSESHLEVSFSEAERRVSLVAGEAHFSVAKNPARPFLVHAGGVQVRAVGTAFNVRLDPATVEVLVTEGRVRVAQAPSLSARPPEEGGLAGKPGADNRIASLRPAMSELGAGQRALLSRDATAAAPVVEHLKPGALQEALAWQEPPLVFTEAPLRDVLSEFNRRHARRIELEDDALGLRTVGGSFRPSQCDTFLRLLENTGDIRVDRSDPARIVLRRAH